jgi:hypothetical protein
MGTPMAAPSAYAEFRSPVKATLTFKSIATLSNIPLNRDAVIVLTKFIRVKTYNVNLFFI